MKPSCVLLSVFVLTVDQRGCSLKALENIDEMACIQVTQVNADLGNALAGFPQLSFGDFYLLPVYVICKTFAGLPVEQPGEVAGAQMAEICHFIHADGYARMAVDMSHRRVYGAGFGHSGIFGLLITLGNRAAEFLNSLAAL